MATFCPSSGCSVYTRPEWTNRRVGETFVVNFCVLGGNIIYSRPCGYADREAIGASLAINDSVVEYVSQSHAYHLQIEDYAEMSGSDNEARHLFVHRMDSTLSLSALVFCNLSTAVSIAVNLGRRLTGRGDHAHIVPDYSAAILFAVSHENARSNLSTSAPPILRGYSDDNNRSLQPVDVDRDPEFSIELQNFSIKGELIDGKILHTQNVGYLESSHIPAIEAHRHRIDELTRDRGGVKYVVVNISGVTGASHAARIDYMKTVRDWNLDAGFEMYVAYGADALQKTALVLGSAIMPFKVRPARNAEHALSLVREDQHPALPVELDERVDSLRTVDPQELRDFLGYIAGVNWDGRDDDDRQAVADEHPLSVLYQSVDLVKAEIGRLFEERKKIEEQLYQARKMESVGRFAAGVAHDINNILCIISGNTQLAMHEIEKDSVIRPYLEDAQQATLRAEDVVKQLLEFSRTQYQSYKPMDAVVIIRDALRLLRATIPARIALTEKLPDDPITISTDSTQINQILMNLFANGVHAIGENSGSLRVSVSREMVVDNAAASIADQRAGEFLQLQVRDTGAGIQPEYIDQIYDPYFTTKGVGQGSGLGLAVVAGIVKAHGGSIAVESVPGEGSTFTLLFPIINEQPKAHVERPRQLTHGTESVLLVEDEVAVAAVMKKMLTRVGYNVDAISNPDEALQTYQSDPDRYDLVVTDMSMPSMTGVELAAKVRDLREKTPVIVCTGHSPLIDDEKAADLGIAALVMKPIEMHDFAAVVRGVLDAS